MLCLIVVTWVVPRTSSGGELNPRFDGKWIGTEIFSFRSHGGDTITMRNPDTLIGIAGHGKLLGVLSGWGDGRYQVSPDSHGNTLIYRMVSKKDSSSAGRDECKLVLAGDGNSLQETGHATVMLGKFHEPTRCQVSATFRRQGN